MASLARSSLGWFLLFSPMACVGTLLHEAGHIAVAEGLGYETALHYGSMSWWPAQTRDIPAGHELLVSAGGPASNMILGSVGLAWLTLLRRRAERWQLLGAWGRTAAITALFWSRQVFNAVIALAEELGEGCSYQGDEFRLAEGLGWPAWSLLLPTAAVGLEVCRRVAFVLVPGDERPGFLLGGLTGSLAGFGLWYGWLGPLALP